MQIELIILCIFAAYGIFEIFRKISAVVLARIEKKPLKYILIVTKDDEDRIEYYIRSALSNLPYGYEGVLVMDMGSKDGTKDILQKFANEGKIRMVKWR